MDIFVVRNPGLMTSIQDLGRFGFLDRGVPPSGALDSFACRIANLLVGNPEDLAVLEITVVGPILEAVAEAEIAITGAEMGATLNGIPIPSWQTVRVKRGDELRIPRAERGCRAYLAVNGGFDVPVLMGSRSTFVRAGFGGLEGRFLKKQDVLKKGDCAVSGRVRSLPSKFIPEYPAKVVLRAIPGPQDDSFTNAMDLFFAATYDVTAQSDRMGCRLHGPVLEHDKDAPKSIVTEPTVPGNVQVPADGQPIILLVEQTTGGYSKIATVISTDIPQIAQLMPKHTVSFECVTLEAAHLLYRDRERILNEIRGHLRY